MGAPILTDQQMDIDGSLFEEDDDFTICTLADAPQPTSQPQDTAAPSTGPAPASEDPAGQIDVQAMQQRAIAMTQQRLNASGGKPQPGQRGPKLPAGLQGSGPSGTVSTKDLTPLDEQMRMLQDFNARQAQGQIIEPAQPSPGPGPQGGDQSGGFGGF